LPSAAVIHGRGVALRRSNIERLHFHTRTRPETHTDAGAESVPA
jgi:hypothetical protein